MDNYFRVKLSLAHCLAEYLLYIMNVAQTEEHVEMFLLLCKKSKVCAL